MKESDSPWQDALSDLDHMLDQGRKKRSQSILDVIESMRDWIAEHEHVTEKQIDAIDRFKNYGR